MLAIDKNISLSEHAFKADSLNKISAICNEGAELFVLNFHILDGFKINVLLWFYLQVEKGKLGFPFYSHP